MNTLINGDCMKVLYTHERVQCAFADPPDNIGLSYATYDDKKADEEYVRWLEELLSLMIVRADTTWLSFNAKWTFEVGRIFSSLIARFADSERKLEGKPCTQVFTFGQYNKHDLGNNHRPLWRLKWDDAPLYPDAIKVPSWRERNGDKRAKPGGRVPGDVIPIAQHSVPVLCLPDLSQSDIRRLWDKVATLDENQCWEWTGSKEDGYGRLRVKDHLYIATRLVWKITRGTDPGSRLVLHACDNPGCCNPGHLLLGSHVDNNQDRERKGRGNHAVGVGHGQSKLSEADVKAIYKSKEPNSVLAGRYGVSDVAIGAVKHGRTWRHVTGHQSDKDPAIAAQESADEICSGDVFDFPRVTGNSKQRCDWHPTQLHEDLVERCIKLSTKPGDHVLDPFGGTGTTLRVCEKIDRQCTLIELDPGYCKEIKKRHKVSFKS